MSLVEIMMSRLWTKHCNNYITYLRIMTIIENIDNHVTITDNHHLEIIPDYPRMVVSTLHHSSQLTSRPGWGLSLILGRTEAGTGVNHGTVKTRPFHRFKSGLIILTNENIDYTTVIWFPPCF